MAPAVEAQWVATPGLDGTGILKRLGTTKKAGKSKRKSPKGPHPYFPGGVLLDVGLGLGRCPVQSREVRNDKERIGGKYTCMRAHSPLSTGKPFHVLRDGEGSTRRQGCSGDFWIQCACVYPTVKTAEPLAARLAASMWTRPGQGQQRRAEARVYGAA